MLSAQDHQFILKASAVKISDVYQFYLQKRLFKSKVFTCNIISRTLKGEIFLLIAMSTTSIEKNRSHKYGGIPTLTKEKG